MTLEGRILPAISHMFRGDTAFRKAFGTVLQAVANSVLSSDVIIASSCAACQVIYLVHDTPKKCRFVVVGKVFLSTDWSNLVFYSNQIKLQKSMRVTPLLGKLSEGLDVCE